ncbi:MAG: type II secretion system F family protein [Actinomycetota bacterium]
MFSNIWLVLALVGTFLTIFMLGFVIDATVTGSRRRAVTLLQAHVGDVPKAALTLREEQLKRSALVRLALPFAGKVVGLLARYTPIDLPRRVNRLIVLAGNPPGWTAERIVAFKIILGIAGLVGGLVVATLLPISGMLVIGVVVLFALIGYTVPSAQISAKASKRQKEIRKSLSDTMDLLTISVEAGLGFDAALNQVVKNVPGALSEEIARMLQEMQIGASRADAFRNLGERTEVPELDGFVLSMIQADKFGVSIANVLRNQSKELRQKRRQRAEEQAQKVPVKLLFPMIFMVLPAMFIVILGPGALKVVEFFT